MTTRASTPLPEDPSGDLVAVLRGWDDPRLTHLLTERPDLAHPAPSSLTAMAARAATRPSVGRILGRLDQPTIAVAESLVVLSDGGASCAEDLARAVGTDVTEPLTRLLDLALAVGTTAAARPIPALREALGPHPLGLGPRLSELGVNLTDGWPTTPSALAAVMSKAEQGAARMLDALTWGPPVGTVTTDIPPAARWLLDAHVLHRISSTQLVLPREIALAARGGRLLRELDTAPPVPEAPVREDVTIAAEGVRAAEDVLYAVGHVLDSWGAEPPAVLRSGGIGVRDVRQVATLLASTTAHAALVVELTAMLALLGQYHDVEMTAWAPTLGAEDWREQPLSHRWAELVAAWLSSPRTPWLAGTRNDKGALRAALEPDLERTWAPSLRRRVLSALAAWPAGSAPDAEAVQAYLAWHTSRSAPPMATVEAILAEAAVVGLTGAGALGDPARLLLAGASPAELADRLESYLPPAVEEIFVQGDLTGVVPGRPTAALAALIESSADVESRGSALTVRFTGSSVRRALEGGLSATELLDRLRAVSRTTLPQPLEYLIADTARKHGQVRVGSAGAFLRSDDPGVLTALVADSRLRRLRLRLIAPTVLVAEGGAYEVVEALRAIGTSPVLEGPDGELVLLAARTVRATRASTFGEPGASTSGGPGASALPVAEVIAAMRAGEQRAREMLTERASRPTATDPVHSLELLRAAAAHGAEVHLIVAGPSGRPERRTVRPLSIEGGRVRVLDVQRGAEITVAVHRITAVRPVLAGD